MVYEWASDEAPHRHLIGDGCGQVHEVVLGFVDRLCEEGDRLHGFAADVRHPAVRGRCTDFRSPEES